MGGRLSTQRDRNDATSDTEYLNSHNISKDGTPTSSDVVVIGAGIRTPTAITVLEKSSSPAYKIGESTLTVFGLWLKIVGIDSPMLWRLFGPKDGLAFYYFSSNGDPEKYTQFVANGPPGDFVPTLQIERKVSELMLTLFAQRLGITVLHGRQVVIDEGEDALPGEGMTIQVKGLGREEQTAIRARLVVDATGRFHRLVSKNTRIERPNGFNTNAFWAYFDSAGDESEIPLRNYESVNTNHLCIPEGWAWVIRLPSWEGSPLPNLINMINHLLDLNAAKTPADEFPSVPELVAKFKVKFRWVVSIGFALRADVIYPDDLSKYGRTEAEQKFNWVVAKYPKISGLMEKHTLIHDLYGPGTTWFIRKNLAFRSPRVTGKNFMAIGDATGFTNPLYSPGINANMSTSICAAELTQSYLASTDLGAKKELFDKYETFCEHRISNLQRMNVFNYVCMRSPALGPLGPLWQYLIGTGNRNFQQANTSDFEDHAKLLKTWDWGANEQEYIAFTTLVCKILDGRADAPLSQDTIDTVQKLSVKMMRDTIATGKYTGRWSGLLRWYDDDLNFIKDKVDRDVLAKRCRSCGEWKMLTVNVLRCAFCGFEHDVEESTKIIYRVK